MLHVAPARGLQRRGIHLILIVWTAEMNGEVRRREAGEEERRSVGPTAKGRFPFCPDEKTFVGVAASLMSFVLVVSRIMFRQKKFGFGCFPLFSRFFWFFPRLIAFLALSLGINIYRFGNIQFCQWTCFGCFGRSLLYRCGRSLSVIAL